ncbi:MAG: hypothetical protein D3916_02415, partial [Candidatus Electrothrix sp. MAN1_4]|nr:hypothetical protein [Candidatus Electrothrix sp. MAN1_4]
TTARYGMLKGLNPYVEYPVSNALGCNYCRHDNLLKMFYIRNIKIPKIRKNTMFLLMKQGLFFMTIMHA